MGARIRAPEHDPEKWAPVFRKKIMLQQEATRTGFLAKNALTSRPNQRGGRGVARTYAAIVLAVALGAGLALARAEYPDRAVTFVVPFAPGGSTDILSRMLAEALHDRLKQPFVVENRPGASMQIGTAAVAK